MPAHPYVALGRRIRERRSMLGFNQPTLADEVGVAASAISDYETGRIRPSVEVLHRLADVLHADYADLAQLAGYTTQSSRGQSGGPAPDTAPLGALS